MNDLIQKLLYVIGSVAYPLPEIVEDWNNRYFETEQHFIFFKHIWKNAVSSPRAKKYKVPIMSYDYDSSNKCNQIVQFHRKYGWITPTHMIFYNIVRGYNYLSGFSNYKCVNTKTINEFNNLVRYAQAIHHKVVKPTWFVTESMKKSMLLFSEPFGEFNIIPMLANCPTIDVLTQQIVNDTHYGDKYV